MEFILGAIGMYILLWIIGRFFRPSRNIVTIPVHEVLDQVGPDEGEYSHINVCIKCNEQLTNHQRMYSSGRCKHCGHKGVNACTIVDTKDMVIRYSKEKQEWLSEEDYDALQKELKNNKQ